MMDFGSIVGTISAVITFVDFSLKLVTGAKEIYYSPDGTADDNACVRITTDLKGISEDLGKRFQGNTDTERRIKNIAEDCETESGKLIASLDNLRIRQRHIFWRSLRSSWKRWRSDKDIQQLKARLEEYRSQIMLHLLVILQDERSDFVDQLRRMEDNHSAIMVECTKELKTLRDNIVETVKENFSQENGSLIKTDSDNHESTTRIAALLRDVRERSDTVPLQHRVLRQLVFRDMKSRHTQIYSANDDTCRWIFGENGDNNSDRRMASMNIIGWLRRGRGILHITGKAGSGKSTFLKFLSRHARTEEELRKWAGGKTLVLADFYFWNPGAKLQMTLSGLYRSLLFEVLSKCPQLIGVVFPDQCRRLAESPGDSTLDGILHFDDNRIEEGFENLARNGKAEGYRFCFFIDGLDECDGNRLAHERLAQRLKTWTEGGDVKICASSRPYPEFLELISRPQDQTIYLHQLNRVDIFAYCSNRFRDDPEAMKTGDSYVQLIDDIVESSQGVFLWAYLVVDILLLAIRQGDPYYVLKKKLSEIPEELDELYVKLRKSVGRSEIDRKRSNKMLLLAVGNPFDENLNAITFSWLNEYDPQGGNLENPNFPDVNDLHPYSEEEILQRTSNVEKQINTLTRGFLEIGPMPESELPSTYPEFFHPSFYRPVRFSHTTARDYFLHSRDRMTILEESFDNFYDSHLYGRLLLAQFVLGFQRLSGVHTISCFVRWLGAMYPRVMNEEIIRKFQIAIQRLQPSLLFSIKAMHNPGEYYGVFCEYSGVHESSATMREYMTASPELLLASLCVKDWKQASRIVENSIMLNWIIHPLINGEVSEWPVWAIASVFIFHHQLSNHDYQGGANEIIRRLHQHASKNKVDFRKFRVLLKWFPHERATINFDVLLKVLAVATLVREYQGSDFIPLVKPQDIGMVDGPESKRLCDALMSKTDLIPRWVWWENQRISFQFVG